MRVAIDVRMINSSGIGRYLRELLKHIWRSAPDLEMILVGNPDCIATALSETDLPSARYSVRSFTAPIYSLQEQLMGSRLFNRLASDLVFFPHYNVPAGISRPLVLTIHDTTHLRFPRLFGRWRSTLAASVMRHSVRHARRVLTNSDATKRDVERRFRCAAGKTVSIPFGVSSTFRPATPEAIRAFQAGLGLPERYILTVGNRKLHKNLAFASRVIQRLQADCPDLAWIVVGERFTAHDALDSARDQLGQRLVSLKGVPDDQLRMLYAGAVALFVPSLWEGFGLPCLEAMACRIPVVGSNIPAFVELIGDAGQLHSLDDPEAFMTSLRRLLTDSKWRERLASKGLERAARYTWARTAQRTWQVFTSASTAQAQQPGNAEETDESL